MAGIEWLGVNVIVWEMVRDKSSGSRGVGLRSVSLEKEVLRVGRQHVRGSAEEVEEEDTRRWLIAREAGVEVEQNTAYSGVVY